MENKTVCVTGAAGYIASHLVNNLLKRGYTVHATLRNLDDQSKVGVLKGFPGAEERLKLFKADIYRPQEFVLPIQGCHFVFHVATPLSHTEGYEYGNRVDASVDAARCIAAACMESGTVRRLIYTASVTAASPLKEDDGNGFKEVMDESCWTPLNLPHINPYANHYLMDYVKSKTLTEKELLSYNDNEKLEVVTLSCGLVGGGGHTSRLATVVVFLSQLTNDEDALNSFKFLEELLGKIPVVHLEDVCNAHIFCITDALMIKGRFLCANSYISTSDIARYYQNKYPELSVDKKHLEGPEYETKWGSSLLGEMGFEYKHDWQSVLDDCITCAKKVGHLSV